MARIRSANNIAIETAILAVARAHAQMPGFDLAKAKDIAVQLDQALQPHRNQEAVVALCITLLRGLGVHAPGDSSRLVSSRDLGGRS